MKVIIAEKPSVAQGIASIVGARQWKDGYLMGDGYAVTWAFGHLVGLAMPECYGFSGFHREHLPILPQEFKLIPRQVREGKVYKDDPGVVRQLGVIRELFDSEKPDEMLDYIKAYADSKGESINGFVNRAIDETMQQDK